jgi:hypothetical protein
VQAGSVLLALGIGGVASFRAIAENDVGWHTALGRVFATEGLRFENALSWTAPHSPWYPTSWLYDLCCYRAYAAWGPGGLQGLTLLFVLILIGGMAAVLRSVNERTGLIVLPGMLMLLFPRIVPRPHVATWAVMACVLACCELARRRGWQWRLVPLPVIALGSNLHSGAAFATGLLALACLEAAWRERRWWREAAIATAGCAALLANPGGPANLLSLRDHLHLDDVLVLGEYRPPIPAATPGFFLLLPLLGFAAWRRWRAQPAHVAAAVVFSVAAFTHGQRFTNELYLVSAPLVAGVAASLHAPGRRTEAWFLAIFTTIGVGMIGREAPGFRAGPRFDERWLPVRVARFIEDEGLRGRFFNAYHDGGMLALLLPDRPVYVDSRPYAWPPGFFDAELAAEKTPAQFQESLRRQGIEWAVTAAYGPLLTGERLLDSPNWALVYWDDVNEVFVRRDVPRFAGLIARSEYRYFRRSASIEVVLMDLLAHATPEVLDAYSAELDRFERYSPHFPATAFARCSIAVHRNDPAAPEVCGRR